MLWIGSSKRAAIPRSASWYRKRTSARPGCTCRHATSRGSLVLCCITNIFIQTSLQDGRKKSFTCFIPWKRRRKSCGIGGRFSSKELRRSDICLLMNTDSVWKPLFGPLQDWPLGLCDYLSIDPQRDLVPSDNIYTHLVTETYNVYHNNRHRWYFLGDMKPDELLVFKSFDTKMAGGNARGALQRCPRFESS